jgi:hypothetical protein
MHRYPAPPGVGRRGARRAGETGLEIEIRGRLQELLAAPAFAPVLPGGSMVARGRYLQSPRQVLPEFSISAA